MKALFDQVSLTCARNVTRRYSTSFSMAVRMLAPVIRQDIYNIYGFVRLADEIVDTFQEHDSEKLLNRFEIELERALNERFSLNPILHAFQQTVYNYNIERSLIDAFMKSMRMDLYKTDYETVEEYEGYIYGSADVVGLMCLQVFVRGDKEHFDELKRPAAFLGSAFQKVNFLRDLKHDRDHLNRSYFPGVDMNNLSEETKMKLIMEIQEDFKVAYEGIKKLPKEARFGVYTAYKYYNKLLMKLKRTSSARLMEARIRIGNHVKIGLLAKSYLQVKFRVI